MYKGAGSAEAFAVPMFIEFMALASSMWYERTVKKKGVSVGGNKEAP